MADQAHHAKDSAAHKAEDTKQFGQEKAGEAQHHTQGMAGDAKDKAGDAAQATQDKAREAKDGAGNAFQQRKTSTAQNVGRKQKSPPDETSEKTIDMAESGQEIPSHEDASKEGGDIIITEPLALVPVQQQVDGSSDRDDKDMDDLIPQSIIKPHGSEFIDSMSLNHGSLPPLIPLCRCLVNERVRVLRKDLSLLKKVFEEEGYLMMKGMFVLSVNLPDGTTKDVDDNIIKTWDKNWQLVNKEFEDEISSREEWSMLRGKMFYVWEGNHRTASCIESIKEMYRNDKKKHVRVMAQFIVPNQQEEMRLIAALQRINIMNEEAIVKTNLKDYLFHTSTNKWKSDLELAIKKISPDLTKDERIKAETLAKRSVVKSYNRRMTRNLSVVNPSNLEEWFNILWKLPFEDDKFKITIEKLYAISCAACSQNLKLKMLKMLGTDDNFCQSYGMPLGDHHYIPWLAKEVWMDQVLEDATQLLYQVVDSTQGVNKVELPIDVHLETYFADIINRYRGVLFYEFQKEMNVATPPAKHVDLKNSSRRLVYRFLMRLIAKKKINNLPDICKAWVVISPPNYCMYTSSIFREGKDSNGAFVLTDWERKHCPWWVDMKKGECLEEEKESYLRHLKGECKSDSGSLGEMSEEQKRRVEDELKSIKEKEELEIHALGKSKGRPSNNKGILLKDTQNLETPIPQKTSSKEAILYAPLSTFLFIEKHGVKKKSKVWIYDYIVLGKEFASRNFNKGFAFMREFYVGLGGGPKRRNSKPSSWSVDLTSIDLPTGLPLHGFEGVPQWNVLTDDHIKFSLLVASCVMDDMGWVLVLCSSSTLVSVERFAKRTGLELGFKWIMESYESLSLLQKHGHMQKVNVFYALAFHKKGMDPPFNSESALKVGTVLQQDLSCEIIGHYLPSSNRARRSGKSGSWRGVLERSPSHMLMFIEALCPQTGTILELGAGTGPILKGSLHTGCGCLVIDNDKDICNDYLSPYIEEFYGTEKVTDLEESDKSSGDFVVYDAPSD
ncbi:hypothetical protein L7F22_009173 [Adiantum nelumboides]|nr:hypothetical protein [Adiantum nelumboides]